MSFTLDSIVPLGRSMEEYRAMFALTDRNLGASILGCADGPASFNAEMTARGRRVVSLDPLYRYMAEEIRARIDATFPEVMEQLRRNRRDYRWDRIPSPEALAALRLGAMQTFLADYPAGRLEDRYVPGELPGLPFPDRTFDLAVCSHYLFLYADLLSADFHVRAIEEMVRVAAEARIFPLLELDTRPSRHLGTVCDRLRESGRHFEIQRVDYEFQRGADRMLRVR